MGKRQMFSNSGISTLCAELASVVSSGITFTDGLFMLAQDEVNKERKKLLFGMLETIEDGGTVYDAFCAAGGFPVYFLEMISIGEKTGRLEAVLRSLAEYYDRQDELSDSVRSAVIYPSVLLVTAFAVMLVLVTYVLPVFSEVFAQLGLTMSDTAFWVMTAGSAISSAAVYIIGGIAAVTVLGVLLYSFAPFKRLVVRAASHTPTAKSLYVARFANALSMTLSGGLDIDESLGMSARLVTNPVMLKKISECRRAMDGGKSFAQALCDTGIFNRIQTRMIDIGFKTGTTDDVMREIARKTEEEVSGVLQRAVNRFEPAMVIIMAIAVGFILLSVMIPLLGIMTVIG